MSVFEKGNGSRAWLLTEEKKVSVTGTSPNLVTRHTAPGEPAGPGDFPANRTNKLCVLAAASLLFRWSDAILRSHSDGLGAMNFEARCGPQSANALRVFNPQGPEVS